MARLRYEKIRRPSIYVDIESDTGAEVKANDSPASGFCARCKERHPLESMFLYKGRYYLCEFGNGRRSSLDVRSHNSIQADASGALERLKALKK